MSQSAVIVVLSGYADIFARFRAMIDAIEPDAFKVLVRSSDAVVPPLDFHWLTRSGPAPFVFSRNANLGMRQAPKSDIVFCGDDLTITTPSFISILRDVAYSDPAIGVAVPELGGQSILVCAYMKRAMLDQVGPLDERFDGYGYEDNQFYTRYESLGWRTQPTTLVAASHKGGTSFYRRMAEGGEPIGPASERSKAKFEQWQKEWQKP